MMYEQTSQEATSLDYPIQTLSTPSTREEIDLPDTWESSLFSLKQKEFKKQSYYNFFPLFEIDLSSIKPHIEIKKETSTIEGLVREKATEIISEEEIALEMIQHDFVTKMSPKKRYKIHVFVRSVRKGEPRIDEPDEFSF